VSVYFGRKGKGDGLIYNVKNKGFYYGGKLPWLPALTGLFTRFSIAISRFFSLPYFEYDLLWYTTIPPLNTPFR
jgi:hypothetical protein